MDENQLREQYTKAGVDLPELKEAQTEPTPAPETPQEPKEEDKEPTEPLQTKPKEDDKTVSIYDRYKSEKSDRKTAEERAVRAERERDELKALLDGRAEAETPAEKQDAQDEIDTFLSSHKEWDKSAIQDLLNIARKGVKPEIDDNLKKDLEDFKAYKQRFAKTVEEQKFNEEFQSIVPSLKQSFPSASEEELGAIRKELDAISHTKDWHDKDLEYIAYKHRDKLSALVSPKKRGMEAKGRRDVEESSNEFDVNADYASMTPAERTLWEKQYKEVTKPNQGLSRDAQGRRLLI